MLYPRDTVEQVTPWLETGEIIVLLGARQVGKTPSFIINLPCIFDYYSVN